MIRLSLYTASIFALFGIILPYWPLWLASRGLGAREIGLVLAAGILTRVALTPAIAAWADRSGERKRIILVLAVANLLGSACYLPAEGFWPILIVTLIAGGSMNGMVVLGDALTLTAAERDGFAYGRVRLWGSAAFLAVAALTGWAMRGQEQDMLLWAMLGILTLTVFCALALPDPRQARREGRFFDIMPLLRSRQLMGMFLVAGLIQNSHHFYYGFSTLHWRGAGLDEALIGGLWAEGVVAEILLFWLAPHLGPFGSPVALLLIGGAGGTLRWAVMACTADPAILAAIQLLHAASFAAAHLGAMQLLMSKAPAGMHTLAQGLYAALPMGLGGAAVTFASGLCYGRWGGDAFWIASGMCAAGTIGTFFMCSFVARLPSAPDRK